MIVFLIFGSSEVQAWAVKHMNNGDINNNLLSSMLNVSDIFV
jgi:hypothetical protein